MAQFVFLHDAFQGGWVWRQTALELRDLGHEAHAPSFAGPGSPQACDGAGGPAEAALDTLTRYFQNERLEGVVLVCAGWSGLLGPSLAKALPSAVRTLVFWDAVVPEPGQSFMELCPPALASAIDGNSEAGEVAPFVSGPLTWLECGADSASLLASFPRRAFTEPYAGPGRADWPRALFVHSPGDDRSESAFTRDRAEAASLAWYALDMNEHPLLARAQELARFLVRKTTADSARSFEGCGRNTMPHEMRLQYCSHYRRRHELAVASEGIDG